VGRAPLEIGKPGNITIRELKPKVFQARCRFRDLDGVTRLVAARGKSRTGAQNALLAKLAERPGGSRGVNKLQPHHRFTDAAKLWLSKIEQTQRGTTYASYRQWLDGRVIPDIGEMRLRELDVGYLDTYFIRLQDRDYKANTLRMIRKVIRGPLELALKHRAIVDNPISHLDKIKGGQSSPRALSPDERRRLLAWLDGDSDDPDERKAQQAARQRDMQDIVRVMLGTGLRIGELLGLRWQDVHLKGKIVTIDGRSVVVPAIDVSGNVTRVVGKGLVRHEGKTAQAKRMVLLAGFVLDALTARRQRLGLLAQPDSPVFAAMTPHGLSWRDPSRVSQWIREVREHVGLHWMTSHVWRKTAATIMHEAGIPTSIIADQLGHKHISMTEDVYLGRGTYSLDAPAALDAAFTGL